MANVIPDRDSIILDAAISCAQSDGYQWITRVQVAAKATEMLAVRPGGKQPRRMAPATINNAYGDMRGLKRAVLKAAVERRLIAIVAQGLADQHPIALEAPSDIKAEAAAHLMSV